MQPVLTRGQCRIERRETRWAFAGWATGDAHENTVRPRGYYRSCRGCDLVVLTLADVADALGLCQAVLSEWLRRAGVNRPVEAGQVPAHDRIDVENVLGDLFAHVWYLYGRWIPGNAFMVGKGNTFTGYATNILRKKIHRFVVQDVGDPTERGRSPKAHSRSLATSYDALTEGYGDGSEGSGYRTGDVGGRLEFAFGAGGLDPTGDLATSRVWLDGLRDRGAPELTGGRGFEA